MLRNASFENILITRSMTTKIFSENKNELKIYFNYTKGEKFQYETNSYSIITENVEDKFLSYGMDIGHVTF